MRTSLYALNKRILDVLVCLCALLCLWPVLLLVALVVRLRLGSPILFIQERPGLGGQLFRMYKFRSMRSLRAGEDMLGSDAQRLTPLGRFLRSTSLDELPGLWNVLCGDMSLVGPRPLLSQYLERYSARQARRHEVQPGLTGWAQIHGRNLLSWPERLELDVWYVEHRSMLLDLRILLNTFALVISRKGTSEVGEATMTEFLGDK